MIPNCQHWPRRLAVAIAATVTLATPVSAQPLPQPVPVAAEQEAVPYRPVPPGGAAYAMQLPPLQANGFRTTLNSNLDADSTLWHFRSAWNVAALNCLDTLHAPILEGYGAFLRKYARSLAAANTALDRRFTREQGSRNAGIKARENHMTQVYNYFALPPAQADFCDAALAVATEFLAAPPATARELAAAGLPRYEAVFQEFYRQYQHYQVASAAWDERWGALFGDSQPGYVAVHGWARTNPAGGFVDLGPPIPPGEIAGPAAAGLIPLATVPEGDVIPPNVQPPAEGGGD